PSPVLTTSVSLSGGYQEGGSLTFALYRDGTLLDQETADVNGDNSYTTPIGYTLPSTGTVVGTYHWQVTYSGDGNNSSEQTTGAGIVQEVTPASPTVTVAASDPVALVSRVPLSATATLSSGYRPTGALVFTLTGPGGTVVDTENVSVTGNGTFVSP